MKVIFFTLFPITLSERNKTVYEKWRFQHWPNEIHDFLPPVCRSSGFIMLAQWFTHERRRKAKKLRVERVWATPKIPTHNFDISHRWKRSLAFGLWESTRVMTQINQLWMWDLHNSPISRVISVKHDIALAPFVSVIWCAIMVFIKFSLWFCFCFSRARAEPMWIVSCVIKNQQSSIDDVVRLTWHYLSYWSFVAKP